MEIEFCPKCHREAYRRTEVNGIIKIIQGKSTLISVDRSSSVSMSVSCPSGHPVKLDIKSSKEASGEGS